MHELEIVKNTQTLYTIRFLCTVDESGGSKTMGRT